MVKTAADTFYGGYAGYFMDPDGHLWEAIYNPQLLPRVEAAEALWAAAARQGLSGLMSGAGVEETPCASAARDCAAMAALKPGRACRRSQ